MVNTTNFQTVKVRKEIYAQLKQLAKDTNRSMRQIVQEVVEPAIQMHIKLKEGQNKLFTDDILLSNQIYNIAKIDCTGSKI